MSVTDWAQLVQYLGIGLTAAAAAIAAAYSRKSANQPAPVVPAPAVGLAQLDRVPIAADGAGANAGAAEIAATILPWMPATYLPAWSQNAGVLPDGSQDPEHWNDCGETCVSMIVAGVWGCPVEPGSIRQYLVGPSGSGLTDATALSKALRHWSIKSHTAIIAGEPAFAAVLASVAGQRNVIMLGRWEGAGTALHWIVAVGNGGNVVQYCDPWDGSRGYITKAHWLELEAGQLVILDSHLHFDCRTWSNPT